MKLNRRSLVSTGLAAGSAATLMAFPMIAQAQASTNWKMTCAYPRGSPF